MRSLALAAALAVLVCSPADSPAREVPTIVPIAAVPRAQGNAPFLRVVALDARIAIARGNRDAGAAAIMAPDTLIMTASWTGPIDDGRGGIDSLRVNFFAGFPGKTDTSFIYKATPFPTSQVWRVIIPAEAYGSATGASATYGVYVVATTYRRGSNPPPLKSPEVSITLVDPAPPNVTGLNLSAVKKP